MNCDYCKKKAGLRCTKCQVAYYCCREHQVADFTHHKTDCNQLKKAYDKVEEERIKLVQHEDGNYFEFAYGNMWSALEPRTYMRARFRVVDLLHNINTDAAIQKALDIAIDCLYQARGDNMGYRNFIPGLFLRLKQYQKAYDFLKWWGTTGQDRHYDWGNNTLPYLDLIDEPMCEDSSSWAISKYPDNFHLTALIFLKIILFQQAKEYYNYDQMLLGTHLRIGQHSSLQKLAGNHLVLQHIESYVGNETFPTRRSLIKSFGTTMTTLPVNYLPLLQAQLQVLIQALDKENPRILRAFVNPTPLLNQFERNGFSRNSTEEANEILHCLLKGLVSNPIIYLYLVKLYGKDVTYDITPRRF